ncbi:hypothetical protein C8Q76DRAFT_453968 [Earliella scabrosa]|nr:hypothetical protein C8Q76DRAFT_453968 [Earliella scabrosa]
MKLTVAILGLAASLVGQSSATTVPVQKRLARQPGCICQSEDTFYSYSDLQNAIIEGESNAVGGVRGYPQEFSNTGPDFPGCKNSDVLYAYPLLHGQHPYTGNGDVGDDRVVYDDRGRFCGCITETKQIPAGSFRCSTFTMD